MKNKPSPEKRFLEGLGPWGKKWDHWLKRAFTETESKEYALVNNIIVSLIFLSILLMVLESVDTIRDQAPLLFDISEIIIVGIFSLEYLINIYFGRITSKGRLRYIFSFWGIIDFLAIFPTYLRIINLSALKAARIFRILRFLRMLRVLKLTRHAANQAKKAKEQKFKTLKFDLQIYFFALVSVVVVFGSLVYFAENQSNPAFSDIPTSMWWCFVTITTVGYGDIYPITIAGRLIAVPTMLSGLVLFGILMNVVGKAMMELLFGTRQQEKIGQNSRNNSSSIDENHIEFVLKIPKDHKNRDKILEKLGDAQKLL